MTFNHIKSTYKWPKIKRKNINGTRHYIDEENNIYNSVTKVVGSIPNPGLDAWRLKVGEDVANHVMIKAGLYGTRLHNYCESYLNNEPIQFKDILSRAHFEQITPLINVIDSIHELEVQMFSKRMKLAGTADCIADYYTKDFYTEDDMTSRLSVIDFKTSTKKKPEDWIESYFLQSTAYALMFEETIGQPIDQIVILMSGEDITQTVFIKDKEQYVDRLYQVIEEFKAESAV